MMPCYHRTYLISYATCLRACLYIPIVYSNKTTLISPNRTYPSSSTYIGMLNTIIFPIILISFMFRCRVYCLQQVQEII